ncbi:MAG TPA: hypothetical protein PKD90_14595 [Phnomibacter sp.]|nr:hypothetical protein [Phnomibacter sp.]
MHRSIPLQEIEQHGFAILEQVYSAQVVNQLSAILSAATPQNSRFRNRGGLYAIRRVLQEIPTLAPILFSAPLRSILNTLFGQPCFLVKTIYFNKPASAN